jgi:hypothetical protein
MDFSDLIPKQTDNPNLSFDDLIPQQPQQPAPDAPWYAKLGGAADDIVRLGLSGLTLGVSDRFAGAMSGRGYEAERAATEQARERAGLAGTVAEIGGAFLPGIGAANAGAAAVRAVAPSVASLGGGLGLASRTAGMGAIGAGMGAAEAAVKNEDIARGTVYGLLSGAGGNIAGEGIAKGIGAVGRAFKAKPAVPSADDIAARASAAYRAADDAGVVYTPQAMQSLQSRIQGQLTDMGYLPGNQPGVANALNAIRDQAGGNVTLKGLDTLRKAASGGFIPGNKSNNAMIRDVADEIDNLVASPRSGDVLMGDARAGADAIKTARELYAMQAKNSKVEELLERAGIRAAKSGTGGNVENTTRQEISKILLDPKFRRGFKTDELDAARDAVAGTATQNALRLVGRLDPTSGGLMAALQLGAAGATGGTSLVSAAAGAGARAASEAMSNARVNDLQRIIRAGGTRQAAFGAPNALERLSETQRKAIAAFLMGGGIVSAP